MKIELTDVRVRLLDSDDFAHFLVWAPVAYDDNPIADLFLQCGAGYLAADGAMISVRWAHAQVEPATAASLENFQAMLSFAESRGWIADGGRSIRAHIERSIDS